MVEAPEVEENERLRGGVLMYAARRRLEVRRRDRVDRAFPDGN